MTPEAKMAQAEQRWQQPEIDYKDIAEDVLLHGEAHGITLSDFEQWAYGKSEEHCNDMSRLAVIAMNGGTQVTESGEIGSRIFDRLVEFVKESL